MVGLALASSLATSITLLTISGGAISVVFLSLRKLWVVFVTVVLLTRAETVAVVVSAELRASFGAGIHVSVKMPSISRRAGALEVSLGVVRSTEEMGRNRPFL